MTRYGRIDGFVLIVTLVISMFVIGIVVVASEISKFKKIESQKEELTKDLNAHLLISTEIRQNGIDLFVLNNKCILFVGSERHEAEIPIIEKDKEPQIDFTSKNLQREAIERGYAGHNPITGEWEWLPK